MKRFSLLLIQARTHSRSGKGETCCHLFFSWTERVNDSVDDVELWNQKDIQGYICETSAGRSPSTILSEYIGYPVHLVVKGPRVRNCPPTLRFPKLDVPSYFQDGYPLLLVSEESVGAVQEQIKDMVGTQGVSEKWAEEELKVERYVKVYSVMCQDELRFLIADSGRI